MVTVVIIIKQSKTDPLRKGVQITLGATQDDICPVKALIPYLAIRAHSQAPLLDEGQSLSDSVSIQNEFVINLTRSGTGHKIVKHTQLLHWCGYLSRISRTYRITKSDAYRHYINPPHLYRWHHFPKT